MPKKKNTERKRPNAGAVELTEQELDKAQGGEIKVSGGRVDSIQLTNPDVWDPVSGPRDPKSGAGSFKAT